jgi:hypothetical protein
MPLRPTEQLETTNVVTQFTRLYALDAMRTEYLQRAEHPIPQEDMQALSKATEEMDALLEQAPSSAWGMDYIIVEHSEELREGYERILSEYEFAGNQKERLQDIVARYGDIVEYGRASAQRVAAMAPVERDTLQAEMNAIRGGGFAAGDLSEQFLCNIAAGCIIGGFFAAPPMNIVGFGIGLAALGGVYASGGEC